MKQGIQRGLITLWILGGACTLWIRAQEFPTTPPRQDVLDYRIEIEVDPQRSFLQGTAQIRLTVLEETLILPFQFNKRMSIIDITDQQGVQMSLSYDDVNRGILRVQGLDVFPAGSEQTLTFRFEGMLERQEFAFLDVPQTEKTVIDSQGALLLTEGYWFPVHRLPLDPATAQVRVTVPLGFSAVAPGTLQPIETLGVTEAFTWISDQPLTQIPVMVSRYYRQQFEEGTLPITFFVDESFSRDLKPLAEELQAVVDFFAAEYGPVPVDHLNVAQVQNVQLASTGAAGLLLLETPLLEAPSLPRMELARRLAQQWWGYSARPQSVADAWLQDGFSNYAALRYLQEKAPDRYATQLAQESVEALKYENVAPVSRGFELKVGSPQYESIVVAKGGWVLYMLGQLVGADQLNGLLRDWYQEKAGQTMTTAEFVDRVQQRSGDDYRWFFVQWVESTGVPRFHVDYKILKLREGGFRVEGQIRQNLELFRMPVDIRVDTKGKPELKHLTINGKSTGFDFHTETLPLRLEMDPEGKILRDSERMKVAVHISLGDEYREQGDFVAAVQEYEKAAGLDARSTLAHFRMGEAFFEQHSYSNAANSLRNALNGDLQPEWAETWVHIYLGKIYDVLGQRQRALAEYQKAVNSQIDYNGAQAEAKKYLDEPYSKPSTLISQ